MKRLAVLLAVILGLGLIADVMVRHVAEGRVAAQIRASLDLDLAPDVSIGEWPFTPGLVSGSIDDIEVTMEDYDGGEITFDRASLHLERIAFSLSDVLAGRRDSVRIARGTGTLTLSEGSLSEALGGWGSIRIARGRAVVSAQGLEAAAAIAIDGSSLVIQPEGGLLVVTLGLPDLGRGIGYRGVELGEGTLSVEVTLRRARLGGG